MKRVIIESPYAGKNFIERWRNIRYARQCMMDSLKRGEAPFLSHLLYTQALNDKVPMERTWGIEAGFEWGKAAELTAVYMDHGVTTGMRKGILRADNEGREVEYRSLELRLTTD